MSLSSDLLSQFAKATKDNKKTTSESTVYGTVKEYNGKKYVQIDGSELLTPTSTTADMKIGERVMVQIKDHHAVIIGNISSPAARTEDVQNIVADLEKIDAIEADNIKINETLTAAKADIDTLKTNSLTVEKADAKYATIENLKSANAEIGTLKTNSLTVETADAKYATIENLNAANATIGNLQTNKLDTNTATATYATIKNLDAANAKIKNLETNSLTAESADIKYANIDFSNINMAAVEFLFSKSGIIENLTVNDTNITGELVGVTIKGDLIEGNTIAAEKLVIKGEDGIYYKLNTDGVTVEAQQTDYNSLNGSIITAKSITASKISVDDLVAFGATIGGFKLTENSIYSDVKSTVDNTTRGIYLDNSGQVAFGDTTNFIKYYKDQNGNYKLEISANSMILSSSNKNIETAFNDVSTNIETAKSEAISTAASDATAKANNALSSANTNTTNLLKEYSKTSEMNAAIELKANGITSSVSETYATKTELSTVEQTANGLSVRLDNVESNGGVATGTILGFSGDTIPEGYEEVEVENVTNYMNFSSSGLVIGDMQADTLGNNVLIGNNNVDIRSGSTTLASFGPNTIYLGKNSETSVINLCNGAATMRVKDDTDFRIYTDKRLVMSAYDSMLLDCWRDSTHMTRIAIQSSDPDDASMVGGVQFTIYQDTIENTVQMLGNDIIHKVTDGTNETYTTMHESIYKVNTSGTIVLNSPSSVQIGDSSSYSFGIRLGSTYTKNKSINCYWSDGEVHDLLSHYSNGQTCYFGAGDIGEVTNTNIRGKYVRLYAHDGGGVYLGYSGSTAVTSDRNMKKDIFDINSKYLDFFDRLRPVTYKYNVGHRDHIGFVAQEVEEALLASGLTTEQFAGLVIEKDVTLNPNFDSSLSDEENAENEEHYDTLYSLRYEEFISLLAMKIQNMQKQIDELCNKA